jgi:hypothetical protein
MGKEMNTSCPDTTVDDLRTARQPFPEPSFLSTSDQRKNIRGSTHDSIRDSSGNIPFSHFKTLLQREIDANRLIRENTYSLYQLGSRINREYCYYLKRVVFYDSQYSKTGAAADRDAGADAKRKMDDLLGCLNYMETYIQTNNQLTPTESQRPLSYQNLGQRIEGMTSDLALRKDMLAYSEEKNRAANSLLALYGFLNLTAIGVLIYIYRSK